MYVALAEHSGSCSNIFYWVYFCFLHDIILKEDRRNSKCKQTHCHSRLSKSILKVLFIYRKNILGKQLSQAICSKYVFRLLHALKFQVFSTKLNMMVKVVKLFITGVSMLKLLWWILKENTYEGVSIAIPRVYLGIPMRFAWFCDTLWKGKFWYNELWVSRKCTSWWE